MNKINEHTETRRVQQGNQTIKRIINTIFGLIQALLVFRLVFKLFGANADNGFVKIIYGASAYFISIFRDIFSHIEIGENGVFEPETVIAMVVLAIINGIIMKLLTSQGSESRVKTQYIHSDEDKK